MADDIQDICKPLPIRLMLSQTCYNLLNPMWSLQPTVKEILSVYINTRWFKYDRDDLCVNKSQSVPVIFEPPCTKLRPRRMEANLSTTCRQVVGSRWRSMEVFTAVTRPSTHLTRKLFGLQSQSRCEEKKKTVDLQAARIKSGTQDAKVSKWQALYTVWQTDFSPLKITDSLKLLKA
jgi:hypothetical protein